MPQTHVSIVVPTYREAQNIPLLARRIFNTLAGANLSGELILVDDDSNDGTDRLVEELARQGDLRLIVRKGERGLSSAVLRGFAEAQFDLLLCMDADLSHPPEMIPALIAPVASGQADMAIGSRYTPGGAVEEDWTLFRRLNSRVATLLARPLTPVRDPMAGFFCLRRETLDRARLAGLSPIGYKIGLELLVRAGCRRVQEVPIEFVDRRHGSSKLTFRQQAQYLVHLLRLYRFRWPWLVPTLALILLLGIACLAWRCY